MVRSAPRGWSLAGFDETGRPRWRRLRRGFLYLSTVLIAGLWGFYVWQPWEFDFVKRAIPPRTHVDPDSSRLFAQGAKVMIVTGHPDDSEFYVGGTLLKLAESKAEVRQLLHTDGDKDYYFWTDTTALRKVRQGEQRTASARWGAHELAFLGFPDGRLRVGEEVIEQTAALIQKWKPEYLLCFDPKYPPRLSHQDHRRSGEIVLAAVERSRYTGWVLHFSTMAPNYVVNVDRFWPERIELLAIHKSQFYAERLQRIEGMITNRAKADAEPGFQHGEGLRCVRYEAGRPLR